MVLIDPKDIWSLSKSFVLSKLLADKVWSFIKWQVSDASRSQSLEYRSRKKYTYKWKERWNIDLLFLCIFNELHNDISLWKMSDYSVNVFLSKVCQDSNFISLENKFSTILINKFLYALFIVVYILWYSNQYYKVHRSFVKQRKEFHYWLSNITRKTIDTIIIPLRKI